MRVREAPYTFPGLGREAFKGLPGLLADALPDRFGNALIDVWLAETGRTDEDFSPVDRLCYIGWRGVGALEFEPGLRRRDRRRKLEIGQLADLANRALEERGRLAGRLGGRDDAVALEDILSVGTSAGGARAKAVLAWNRETGEFRSGQMEAGDGFEDWLLKFDGVANSQDQRTVGPAGVRSDRVRVLPDGTRSRDRDVGVPAAPRRRAEPLHDPALRPRRARTQDPYAVVRGAAALRLQRGGRVRLRAGDADDPGAWARHVGGGRAVPAHGVQHRSPESGRPRQEHRVPDGSERSLAAIACV